jgi:hypothetical protein
MKKRRLQSRSPTGDDHDEEIKRQFATQDILEI